jgi:ElaB/YqjD/DUF883 family membrane-anchored ribosome-binding protein
MKTTSAQVNEDIAILREDLRRLREDLRELPSYIRSYGRSTIMRSREKLRDAVVGLEHRAADRARSASESLKEHGHHAMDRARGEVGYRPMTSLAVAFAAGLLFGFAIEHKCRG